MLGTLPLMGSSTLDLFVVQVGLLLAGTIPLRFAVRHHTRVKLGLDVFVFAMLSAMFISRGIEPFAAGYRGGLFQGISLGAAKAAWWISLALLLVNIIRHFVVFEHRPREGRLVRDLLSGVVYIGTALSLIAYVFNVPVGTLIATSGVFAIVIGLALQSTLNDVFSGIALNLGRPYLVGDWIVLDDNVQGKVIETNWRSTHLLNSTNDVVIVPNSTLAKSRLTNFSSPDESHGMSVAVRFLPTERPELVVEAMKVVLLGCTKIMRPLSPSVSVTGMDSDGIGVELTCRVRSVSKIAEARNEIYDLIYRHARSYGLLMSPSVTRGATAAEPFSSPQTNDPLKCLLSVSLFQGLSLEEKSALSQSMIPLEFAKGRMIARQGTSLTSLILIQKGVIVVEHINEGHRTEITRLSPGEFFGERGVLMGVVEPGDITALTAVKCFEIPKDRFAGLLRDRPIIAEEVGSVLAHRIEIEKDLLQAVSGFSITLPVSFSARIKTLFGLH